MIVYPSGFVLSQAGASPSLEYPRVGYRNLLAALTASNITVSSETATGPRDAPTRPDTAEYWEQTAVPATYTADLLSLQDVDFVGLAGHNLATVGASVEIRLSDESDMDSYLSLPGTNGNRASTPSAAIFNFASSNEVVVGAALTTWAPVAEQALLSKWVASGNQRAYQLTVEAATGKLIYRTSPNGTTVRTHTSSVATGIADGSKKFIKASRDASTGVVKFYLGDSKDGPWVQLGADVAGTVEGLFSSSAAVEVGASDAGTSLPAAGKIYYGDVRGGVGGSAVERFLPDDGTNGASSFASGQTGVVWTVSTSGSPAAVLRVKRFSVATAPSTNKPIMFLDTLRNVRFFRLTLTGAVARIPVIYVGKALAMEKRVSPPYKPIDMARESVLNASMSRGGQFVGQGYRRRGVSSGVQFKNLTAAWVRANFDAFSQSARSIPYFFAWNPQGYPNEVGYVWTDKDIVPSYNGNLDNMDAAWDMVGLA